MVKLKRILETVLTAMAVVLIAFSPAMGIDQQTYSPSFYIEPHIGLGGIGPSSRLNFISLDKGSAPGYPG